VQATYAVRRMAGSDYPSCARTPVGLAPLVSTTAATHSTSSRRCRASDTGPCWAQSAISLPNKSLELSSDPRIAAVRGRTIRFACSLPLALCRRAPAQVSAEGQVSVLSFTAHVPRL
jgi:hypothetical protein